MGENIDGYEVEAIRAEKLNVGDTVATPYSATHLGRWVGVSEVKDCGDGNYLIGLQTGGSVVGKDRIYKRRLGISHPAVLCDIFARNGELDDKQTSLLLAAGYLVVSGSGGLVLTQSTKDEFGLA